MAAATVPEFSPEARGFRLANTFSSVPVATLTFPGIGQVPVGNAANGVCGGMVFAVADYFQFRVPIPGAGEPPGETTALFKFIARRLIDSFDLPWGPARYFEWMALPDEDRSPLLGLVSRTRQECVAVRAALDARRVVPLGLIRAHSTDIVDLGKNHQVLAYGYDFDESTGELTLKLYDPNHPLQEVGLRCCLRSTEQLNLRYSTGEPTRGLFVSPYVAVNPTPGTPIRSPWNWFIRRMRAPLK